MVNFFIFNYIFLKELLKYNMFQHLSIKKYKTYLNMLNNMLINILAYSVCK